MATQGLLSITRAEKVVAKIVTGADGYNIPALAESLRKNPTIVLPVDSPNESGWWWGRSKDADPLDGDEFCVDVRVNIDGRVTIFWGRDYGYLDEWEQFQGCDWIPAPSPWQNAQRVAPPGRGQPDTQKGN